MIQPDSTSTRAPLVHPLIIAIIGIGLLAAPAPAADRPPNVVVIFIDDMAYADIGPFGCKDIATPNLDRMAKEGRVFTDFYVAQAVCSASRAALMTGCYNVRVSIQSALGPRSKIGLNPAEVTIAEICKQKNYATACFGKWHLGDHPKFLPTAQGFDEYFGLPYSNDMWPYHPEVMHLPLEERLRRWPHLPLIEGDKVINPQVTDKDQEQLTTWYTQRAVSFIERNKDKPFFLYMPHSMVHVPLFVSDKFKGKSKRGLFGDVVMEVDWSVGEILAAIKKHGLDENTLVIFTSDNGPWLSYGEHAGSALPLREGKGTMFDGGCRVPTVMRWPGKIPAGGKCSELAATIDILPTVAKLIGAKLPEHKIDGLDISSLMFESAGAKSPREAYYFYWGRELQAVRSGKWKLHFPHGYRTLAGKPGRSDGKPIAYQAAQLGLALFDLEADIGETTNVADKHPEVVERLKKLAEVAREDLGDSATKQEGKGVREVGRL